MKDITTNTTLDVYMSTATDFESFRTVITTFLV